MKSTSNAFREHLDGDVTALCTCWKITRKDGVTLRFTDADQDVTRDGEVYQSIGAYSRSAIESTSDLSVDNLEVTGMATELALPVEELRAGAYDHAEIEVFMTSWMQAVGGKLRLRRGFFGEVRVLPNGTFTVELRGIMQRLSHTYTDTYSSTCRHDLGDAGCGVDISHPFHSEGAHIPFPIQDSDFEEVGAVGMGASYIWYNPVNDEELIDSGTTYSGTFAAHGAALGGRLQQDVSLFDMGDEFLEHVDANEVDLYMHGWRKDDGDQGRLNFQFLDAEMRELRRSCGSLVVDRGRVDIPEVRITGDWTVEFWARMDDIITCCLWSDESGNYTNRLRALWYDASHNELEFRVHENGIWIDEHSFSIPFAPEQGEWFHIAMVYENDVITTYINGEIKNVGEVFPIDLYIDTLGRGYISTGLDGAFDEFRVWNVARTQAQINEHRFHDLPGGNPELERYYPFDGDRNDYGINETAALTDGVLSYDNTPVVVAHRGQETGETTGFSNVGTEWTLVETGLMNVPPYTRYVRFWFDHQSAAGTPEGTRLDSLFGWFTDNLNQTPMPNFTVGSNDAVWTRAGMATSGDGGRIFRATIDEPRASQDGWFQGGLVTFYSGKNKGASMEVKRWTPESNQIELFLSLPYPVEQGDLFTIYPGCDKTRVGCAVLFKNVINFFGTPDVPGEDELFRYPDAK
ncbi:hypothetical protein MAL1_00080 [Bacteriophage DSS3_MAL1]|nr:hypothetical protein MAL1_00080 [Bacteriophage DSS3_MAL1]